MSMINKQTAENTKPKVLIIINNEFILKMYQIKLEKRGVSVETFFDAEGDIVQRIADAKPNLLVLDIVIHDKSGLEIVRQLKEDERTKDIPFLFATCDGQPKDVEEAKELGAVGFITRGVNKPKEVVNYILAFLKPSVVTRYIKIIAVLIVILVVIGVLVVIK